jgi:FkbM family methyltransferase
MPIKTNIRIFRFFIIDILSRFRKHFRPTSRQKELIKWEEENKTRPLRFDYDLGPQSMVMDLGGYEGQWSSDIFSRYLCKIFVFEPVHKFAQQIKTRFSKNPAIKVCPFGLGANTRKESIGISADASSVYSTSSDMETIEIHDVQDWFITHKIDKVDLMKINIEGGEYELLERLCSTGLIKKIVNVQIQFHELGKWAPERMKKIQEVLSESHAPTYLYRFYWENWRKKEVLPS